MSTPVTGPVACAWCGAPAGDPPPLDWVSEAGGPPGALVRWYCPACAREHLRSIEARLDREWW